MSSYGNSGRRDGSRERESYGGGRADDSYGSGGRRNDDDGSYGSRRDNDDRSSGR